MWRKTACAAAGLVLAGAAAYALTPAASGAGASMFDLSFLYSQRTSAKGDRLSLPAVVPASGFAISFNLPAQRTTVIAKNPPMPPVVQSALRFPRHPLPVHSVKPQDKPEEMARKPKPKLPEGCESAFSPVTVPSLAHVASRCAS
jgi:hypothetical protein